MKMILVCLCCCAILLSGRQVSGAETVPPTPVKPPVPAPPGPATPPGPASHPATQKPAPNPNNEMLMLLLDMQNGDAVKRDAAGKTLVTKGAAAYRSMTQFLNSPDADLVKRAKDIRTQIEQRGMQLFQEANTVQGKALSGALSAASLEEVRKAWMAAGSYAPQPELRQNATQAVQSVQMMMSQLEEANKEIAAKDAELAATPPPVTVARAAIQLARAQAFSNVQRFDDALKAAQDAFASGGRDCRHAPAALRVQIEMLTHKGDFDGIEKACNKLIADYAESLEARFAYSTLADLLIDRKRWDEAVEAVKKFVAACPLEDDAQESADKLVDALMEKERDYPRAYGFSAWIKQRLPISRVRPEVLKILGCCSEYALKDFAKAEIAYKSLATDYADVVTTSEIDAVLKRIKAKADGSFPKEPKPGDEGPAGALAQFIAAVRERDGKKLGQAVPADEAIEAAGKLTCEECELIHTVTFADFIVKKAAIDGDNADITIDYYDAASNTPRAITQKAVKEKGAWKIKWTEPDEQLIPVTPKTPVPAPAK